LSCEKVHRISNPDSCILMHFHAIFSKKKPLKRIGFQWFALFCITNQRRGWLIYLPSVLLISTAFQNNPHFLPTTFQLWIFFLPFTLAVLLRTANIVKIYSIFMFSSHNQVYILNKLMLISFSFFCSLFLLIFS
jgi:hypothetical protein